MRTSPADASVPKPSRSPGRSILRALDDGPIRAAKNLRNDLVDRWFRSRDPDGGRRLAGALSARGVRRAVFTVAFNGPWVVDLLTRGWTRHQPDVTLVVVDNSTDRTARDAHAELCRDRGVPYLPLPRNPEWNPNRSHGIALNWTWFNVVRHVDLEFVGFVDHDCVPVAGFDIPRHMRDRDAYGHIVPSTTRAGVWNVWPGYCFLRTTATATGTVDFKHRIDLGLDTGGGSWPGVYRHLDPSRVGAAAGRRVRLDLGTDVPTHECGLFDEAFLHLEGSSYLGTFRDPALRQRLMTTIEAMPPGWLAPVTA